MNQNEKIAAIAEKDRCWAELREHHDQLVKILTGKRSLDEQDFILFYQCVSLVFAEILTSEEDFSDKDESEDCGKFNSLLQVVRDAGIWKNVVNEKLPAEKRLEAITKLRKSSWRSIVKRKSAIAELMSAYPDITAEHMHTMMQCIAISALEIDLRGREIEIIS